MQKKYAVLRVKEWRKRYENSTDNFLVTDGFHSTNGICTGLDGPTVTRILVNTPDDQTFEKKKYYLMSIEELPDLPEPTDDEYLGLRYKKLIEERQAADNGATPMTSGRKFRI